MYIQKLLSASCHHLRPSAWQISSARRRSEAFCRQVSWLPCLGHDTQHHLVTRQSSWLPPNTLQTEAMCLWITAPRCRRLHGLYCSFFLQLLPAALISLCWSCSVSSPLCNQTVWPPFFSTCLSLSCSGRGPAASVTRPPLMRDTSLCSVSWMRSCKRRPIIHHNTESKQLQLTAPLREQERKSLRFLLTTEIHAQSFVSRRRLILCQNTEYIYTSFIL